MAEGDGLVWASCSPFPSLALRQMLLGKLINSPEHLFLDPTLTLINSNYKDKENRGVDAHPEGLPWCSPTPAIFLKHL